MRRRTTRPGRTLTGLAWNQAVSSVSTCVAGKHGRWLNIAEIELSVLSRQCLDRRIGEWNLLRQEVTAWTARRNQPQCKINWRFTTADARVKLKKLYPSFHD